LDASKGQLYSCSDATPHNAVWISVSDPGLPGDAVASPMALYGMKALRADYQSGACIDVVRQSDSVVRTFYFTNGLLVQTEIQDFLSGGNVGRVSKWYDQSGNGRHATQTTNSNRPVLRIRDGKVLLKMNQIPGSSPDPETEHLILPSGVAPSRTASTVFFVGQLTNSDRAQMLFEFGNNPASSFGGLSISSSQYIYPNGSTGWVDTHFSSSPNIWQMVNTASSSDVLMSGENIYTHDHEDSSMLGNPSGGAIGYSVASSAYPCNQEVEAFLIWGSTAMNSTQTGTVRKAIYKLFNIFPQAENDLIFCMGDSWTEGQNSGLYEWPRTMQGLLNRPCKVINFARPGNKISTDYTNYPTLFAPYYSATPRKRILVTIPSSNDTLVELTLTQWKQKLQDMTFVERQTGWHIVVANFFQGCFNDTASTGSFANAEDASTYMKTTLQGPVSVVDLWAEPSLVQEDFPGAYADLCHLDGVHNVFVATKIAPHLNAILGQ
jgi:hypothetical protein